MHAPRAVGCRLRVPFTQRASLPARFAYQVRYNMAHSVLVYGGAGQLGTEIIAAYKARGWDTYSVDLRKNEAATHALTISGADAQSDVKHLLASFAQSKATFDAIVCVAGGWAGGSAAADDFLASMERMWKYNAQSAASTAHVAAKTLKENGLLVLTGAAAALHATPTMLAYGMSKAATHQIIKSLAADHGGLPRGAAVVGIAPIILDTATNRRDMPTANFDDWTPLPVLACMIADWSEGKGRPATGKMLKIITKSKVTITDEEHY